MGPRIAFALLLLLAAFAGCSDDDPRYGPPGGISGRAIDFGDDATAGGEGGGPVGDDAGVPATDASAQELFAQLYATITDPSPSPPTSVCIPCHRDTQSPMFVKSTAELTRAEFLSDGFDNIETGRFYNKGQHEGNPLKPAQQVLTRQWAAAEHPGDAGRD